MGKPAPPLALNAIEKQILETLADSRHFPPRMRKRARIILLAAKVLDWPEIYAESGSNLSASGGNEQSSLPASLLI